MPGATLLLAAAAPAALPAPFVAVDGGFGVAVGGYHQEAPLQVETVGADGAAAWSTAPYAAVSGMRAEGAVASAGGSRFDFTDEYAAAPDGFTVSRTVRVAAAGRHDAAFASRYAVASAAAARIRDREFFVPGVWYLHSEDVVPPGSIAADLDAGHVLVREDRLPLPLVMARDPGTGDTAALAHTRPDGATFTGEDHPKRIVDERMQFGSLGVVNDGHLQLAFQFPGSEGDRTYINGRHDGWANRSHPLRLGFAHNYSLRVTVGGSSNYSEAVQATWRRAFDDAAPSPPQADADKVYRAGMDLLARYGIEYDGVPSMPFRANLPDGVVDDSSSQMGFVGVALPAAALLLSDAVATGDAARRRQAEALVNFWVNNSMDASGQPKTWYDPHPGGSFTFRADSPYMGHLRIASEGMHGVLDAWQLARDASWLACARRYGDFLVARQAADGSIAGEWKRDGTPWATFKNVADQPVTFLIELYNATGDAAYREAAVKAGEYSASQMQPKYQYQGGACDNPDVLDKEAGILAMRAFIALYDLTRDRKWVAPAVQAATYCETWTYSWDIPIPKDDPDTVYPASRTTLGVSLIASGQSGADNFMAIAVYDYYRLYLLTGDAHFLRFSQFLSHATKQVLDWDGTLGYAFPGLMNEAISLAPVRGHGVRKWLPWLTFTVLDPMMRMKAAFGSYDIDRIERLPLGERVSRAWRVRR